MWTRWTIKTIEEEIEITPRDLDYLQFIFDCGPSRTSALHEYFNAGKTKQVTYRRLEQFSSRPYTFLVKPRAQRRRESANYRDLIYDITDDGIDLLIAHGRLNERHKEWRKAIDRGGFWHSAMGGARLASIKLGLKRAGLTYVSKFELFERMNIKPKTNPLRVDIPGGAYKCDDLFGILETSEPYLVEDDMRNEPTERITSIGTDFIEKVEKVDAHRKEILAHFKFTKLNVLVLTTSPGHMLDMFKKTRRFSEQTRKAFAYQADPIFDPLTPPEYDPCEPCKKCKHRGRVPKLFDDRCFSRPYQRVGFPDIQIGGSIGKEATAA